MRLVPLLLAALLAAGCATAPAEFSYGDWQPADVRYAPQDEPVTMKSVGRGFDAVMNTLAFIGDGMIRTGFAFAPR